MQPFYPTSIALTAAQIVAGDGNNLPGVWIVEVTAAGAPTGTWHQGTATTPQQLATTATVAASAAVPDWQANRAYVVNELARATAAAGTVDVGDIIRSKTARTSGPTFNSTETSNWDNLGADLVRSVAGKTGVVTLAVADVPGAEATANKGAVNGYAGLDASGRVSSTNAPAKAVYATGGGQALTASDVGAAASTHTHAQADVTNLTMDLAAKQAALVSGANIKTLNGASILGSGDVFVAANLPGGAAATINDEGLNAGNATLDRAAVAGQTILSYRTVGSSTFVCPIGVTSIDLLVVGGGGGGGTGRYAGDAIGRPGGGGGAGGYRAITGQAVVAGTSYTVSVGSGGAGATDGDDTTAGVGGTNGGNSVFGTIIAAGGGHGGGHKQDIGAGWDTPASTGGSGGGSSNGSGGAAGNTPATTPSQGNAGGSGALSTAAAGGGGGGAGAAGGAGNGTTGAAGAGGSSTASSITGASVPYAAGGAGSTSTSNGHVGTAGSANTGNGGGGAFRGGSDGRAVNTSPGGNGGSGIVVIRFTTQTRSYQALSAFANDAAAAAGNIRVGEFYLDSTSGAVRQRIT